MASSPIASRQIDGETMAAVRDFGLQSHCKWWLQAWNRKMLAPWKKSYNQPRQHIKKQRHYFANKVHLVKASFFFFFQVSCMDVRIGLWSRTPKNWCFWIVVLEKTPESPLDYKVIQPVHPKENQSWIFIGRTDVETETPILWPPEAKN